MRTRSVEIPEANTAGGGEFERRNGSSGIPHVYFDLLCQLFCIIFVFSPQVRRRILEAIKHCPQDIGEPLTWVEKVLSVLFTLGMMAVNLQLFKLISYLSFDVAKLSWKEFLLASTGISVAMTFGLYFYFTEMVHWKVFGGSGSGRAASTKEGKSKSCQPLVFEYIEN